MVKKQCLEALLVPGVPIQDKDQALFEILEHPEATGHRTSSVIQSVCRHHWLLEPDAIVAVGICIKCREIRLFNPRRNKTVVLRHTEANQDLACSQTWVDNNGQTCDVNEEGGFSMEKTARVIAIEIGKVYEVTLCKGTTASRILSDLGLSNWQLMTRRGRFLHDDEDVFPRIGLKSKLYVFDHSKTATASCGNAEHRQERR